ncbi:MAG: hypothetical protein ACOX89_05165 [Lutispora sp.]
MIPVVLRIILMIICIIGFSYFLIFALRKRRIIEVIAMFMAILSSLGFLA